MHGAVVGHCTACTSGPTKLQDGRSICSQSGGCGRDSRSLSYYSRRAGSVMFWAERSLDVCTPDLVPDLMYLQYSSRSCRMEDLSQVTDHNPKPVEGFGPSSTTRSLLRLSWSSDTPWFTSEKRSRMMAICLIRSIASIMEVNSLFTLTQLTLFILSAFIDRKRNEQNRDNKSRGNY